MSQAPQSDLVILDVEGKEQVVKKESTFQYLLGVVNKTNAISLREKVIFFRSMATMVNASMTVLKGLSALRRQEKSPNMQKFYDFMIERVQSGYMMNEVLQSYYGNFTSAECSIIEAGEKTGRLNESLLQIAEQTEKIESIRRKVKGAMTYPMVLIVGMILVVSVLLIKVVPTLVTFFGDEKKLPGATQMILKTSRFLGSYWFFILLGVGVIYLFVKVWKRSKNGKYRFDKILINIPGFGKIIRKVILSKFARVFSNLIGSGISVVESIRITADAVGNEVYRQRILLLREDVKSGMKMAESLEGDPLFPDLLVAMLRVGEDTAQVQNTVIKIAEFYDEEVDLSIDKIQTLVEPIIMVVMGIVIAFIAIGIYQPMMQLGNTIGQNS
ncbi:type II secretion system F family protein [Candidatus Gracilibacteria bacterium]|nr:type II secretion system F family protein [Candidatus Gracilibacteria bacterium]